MYLIHHVLKHYFVDRVCESVGDTVSCMRKDSVQVCVRGISCMRKKVCRSVYEGVCDSDSVFVTDSSSMTLIVRMCVGQFPDWKSDSVSVWERQSHA